MTTGPADSLPVGEKKPNDRAVVLGFLLFNAAFRLALVNLNRGEYTDGILQIIQFHERNSFWPPLYTALISAVHALGVEQILAGRLISIAASVLLILPLWAVARAWGGRSTALFTLALYTASPMALRWSLRVMTDIPFALFFHLACAGLLLFWSSGRPRDARLLVWTTLAAVAATLTRYQGLMLAPPLLLALAMAWRARSRGRWIATLSQVLWLALPAWLLFQNFGHFAQIAERESPLGFWSSLLNYWYYGEMFVFLGFYFFTLPVFLLFLYGLLRGPAPEKGETVRAMPIYLFFLYVALAVLTAQSLFQSFQERYLMPLMPLMLTFAGAGLAHMEQHFAAKGARGRRIAVAIAGVTIVWSMGFGLTSAMLQRGAYQDIYESGHYIRSLGLPPTVHVYTNETYRAGINGVKLAFAAKRPVELIPELEGSKLRRMEPGSVVAIHSWYAGGMQGEEMLLRTLREQNGYDLQPLNNMSFHSSLVPLLPDIMEAPFTNQNPLAWLLRYVRQDYRTDLFVVAR